MKYLNSWKKMKDFNFGISDEFYKLALSGTALTSKNITLDHTVPNTIVIQKIKKSWIKNPNQLLKFLNENYFMC